MATDLANAIISTSREAFEEQCNASVCEVQIFARRERFTGEASPYILKVTPTENHVLVQYADLTFKAPRADATAFKEMLSGLYGMLSDKCAEDDNAERQDPDFPEWQEEREDAYHRYGEPNLYEEAMIRVVRRGKVQVEMKHVAREDLEGVFMRYMGAMRFLSC